MTDIDPEELRALEYQHRKTAVMPRPSGPRKRPDVQERLEREARGEVPPTEGPGYDPLAREPMPRPQFQARPLQKRSTETND